MAEEDGLEKYYRYDANGTILYLLSNNMSTEDRFAMQRLWYAHERNTNLAYYFSCYLGLETVLRVPYFKGMAYGWRILSVPFLAGLYAQSFNYYTAQTYGPLIGAYLRKYRNDAKADMFDITDRKREYYEIDTSQYMDYTNEDHADAHTSFGPMPDGEQQDASWLTEMDKFLNGKPNNLKAHSKFVNYEYQFVDKSFPTQEMAGNLIRGEHHHEIL